MSDKDLLARFTERLRPYLWDDRDVRLYYYSHIHISEWDYVKVEFGLGGANSMVFKRLRNHKVKWPIDSFHIENFYHLLTKPKLRRIKLNGFLWV